MRYQTIAEVIKAETNGTLREWIIDYLQGEGGNPFLARHIRERPAARIVFTEYPITGLKRLTGPEKEMLWREDTATWERGVMGFLQRMEQGIMPLPLILTDFWDDLHISDGTHRHEALRRAGKSSYLVIFLLERPENITKLFPALR